jgi:hypothetical protein
LRLLELLSIVPFDELVSDGRTLLNPTFGAASRLVGGADADLICGDMLVDLKTVKTGSVQLYYCDQLLGYFILARYARRLDKSFPFINRLALYFARHGYLWTWSTKSLQEDKAVLGFGTLVFKRGDGVMIHTLYRLAYIMFFIAVQYVVNR